MNDFEKELKKNGTLLKTVPSKECAEQQQELYDESYYQTMIANMDDSESPIGINEIALPEDFLYLRPVEDDGHAIFEPEKIPIFYVSDIHLLHRIKHRLRKRATRENIHAFIKKIVKRMITSIGTVPYNSFLLIAGDTSSVFEFSEVFYTELAKCWPPERIVVVLGNHELLDPAVNMKENVCFYRDFFGKLGINFLQNDLLCFDDDTLQESGLNYRTRALPRILSAEKILRMTPDKLSKEIYHCPLLILGGIGFSGLNEEYNAANLQYGCSFDTLPRDKAREKEIFESARFNRIYKRLKYSAAGRRLIVLTHMQKEDWDSEPYVPCWTYVSGHNHRNLLEINDLQKVFADNQIGYRNEQVGLKFFYTDNDYDTFADYADGIYDITENQYEEFNRGKRIDITNINLVNKKINMLKKNGYYMFLYYGRFSLSSKNENLYLLNGGRIRKLDRTRESDIQYYYENIEQYVGNVHNLIDRYTGVQKRISQFIKRLGGSGKIHGCIVDVDMPARFGDFSYAHVFVNPIDGTVTPYYATDVKSRVVYKDFKSLLENNTQCKKLLIKYKKIEAEVPSSLPMLHYGTSVAKWGEDDSVYDEGGYLYPMSRIIRSLQYCSDKKVIRIWNENLLNRKFVEQIMVSDKIEEVLDDRLIMES